MNLKTSIKFRDEQVLMKIDALVEKGTYRNRTHAIEELLKKQLEEAEE